MTATQQPAGSEAPAERVGRFGRLASIGLSAAPPLVSQLTFSVVSFFSVAAVARAATRDEMAAFIATYSIESIAVSYTNARWANLLVFKEELDARRGDIWHLTQVCSVVTLLSVIPFFLTAWAVHSSWHFALLATLWTSAMLLGDTLRYVGSRFLGMRPVLVVGGTYAVLAIIVSFLHAPIASLLVALATLAVLLALGYLVALLRNRPEGTSRVWRHERVFGRSMGTEAVLSSAATGLAGALLARAAPAIAVGLQLGNQVLGMPTNVLTNAASLPLARRMRASLEERRYPRRLLALFVGFSVAVPVIGIGLIEVLRPVVRLLLGNQAPLAYALLPVVFLQTVAFQHWLPMTMARRWTHGPNNPRDHMVVTNAVYYAALVAVASLVHDSGRQRFLLVLVATALLVSTAVRTVQWYRTGFPGGPVVPRRALPEDDR